MTDIRNPIVLTVPAQVMPGINPNQYDGTSTVNWALWDGDPSNWTVSAAQLASQWFTSELTLIGTAMKTIIANPGAAPITCGMSFGAEAKVDTNTVSGRATIRLHVQNPPGVDLYAIDFDNVAGVYAPADTVSTYASRVADAFVKTSLAFS